MIARELAALHAVCFPEGEAWSPAAFTALCAMPGVRLSASDAGFILLRIVADEAEVLTLCVHPTRRRSGVGRALLAAAEHLAFAEGALHLFIDVAEPNVAARALYAACGYREVGRRPAYYPGGAAALVLARGLMPGDGQAKTG